MENKKQLNTLVERYQSTKDEEVFNHIYSIMSKKWKSLDLVARSIHSDSSETLALYEDTLIKCLGKYDGRADFENFYNRYLWRERRGLYRKKKTTLKNEYLESYLIGFSPEAATFDIPDDIDVEGEATKSKRKKDDQLALIDFFVHGENERTTAIVQAYLETDLKTPTAIGKYLGLNHKQVTRALTRLAAKYDSKQYGDYTDYLVAL